jgi:hypothetical protein
MVEEVTKSPVVALDNQELRQRLHGRRSRTGGKGA